jgi:beta-glucosidase/6-phospho-beta-glucosidase/beta-galactosidase
VGKSDYLGVNYYTHAILEGERDPLLPDFSPLTTFNALTLDVGETFPRGIYDTVMWVKKTYPGVPMVITENGADASKADATPFLVQHLLWLKRAIDEGADVRGYHWWTLTDNYEWNHGMTFKLGLWGVDPKDSMKARTKRAVADAYGRVTAARAVPKDLAAASPIGAE